MVRTLTRTVVATVAVTVLMLLRAAVGEAQIVGSGKTLTVTTANAVATFNGPDLVGLTNALTNEQYLKKPSHGDLAQVDAISSTAPALQSSNWSIGTEQGTGLPLATITTGDSLRTLTTTVKIDPASQEIVLRSSASVTSPGVRGASWSIAGLDLAGGHWIVPGNAGAVFDRNHPGINAFLQYPYSWQAQMGVYEAALGSFLVYSTDSHFYSKDLHQTSRGDDALDVAFYTESIAPFPSATTVPTVEWRLKAFAGDWRVAAQPFRDWMVANRPPVSNAAHPWVSNIRTVVGVSGQDSTILAPLAAVADPSQTLLYLIDWRQSGYDVNYPDYTPGPGTAAFVTAAHNLGFKVMVHTDLIGVSPNNPDYAAVQQYQARTPESLQLMGWNWDQPPTTPQRYGLIDPAAAALRSLWISRIGAAVSALNPDALHLDFTAMYNDGNGPIEGRTFAQGEDLFNQQIIAAFPNLALGSEEESDFTYRYHSFAQAGLWAFPNPGHPIVTFLFSPQLLHYGHLNTPRASNPTFKSTLVQQAPRAVFPMWLVWTTADLDASNADNARFIGMVQSWQSHQFQPAWSADWTGALVRYQGLSGSTAALTDSSTTLTLTGAGATLFQVAHDTNQVTSGSYIPSWPAFDTASLFGLNRTKQYFLDPLPRPTAATHITSLPADITLDSGTLVGSAFAHVEVASSVSSFDFNELFHTHMGVSSQGVDTPLGNGAVVNPSGITAGGVGRSGLFIHPPYQGQVGGETFVEFSAPVPIGGTLAFSVGIDDGATCTDGVTFRVTANGTELWNQNFTRGAWHDAVLDLAVYGGSTIALRLISNPGPASNPSCDWSLWSQLSLAGAPTAPISVPLSLAAGSVVAGFAGNGTLSTPAPLSATVSNVRVPGAFTVFTQSGTSVSNGANLANVPFQVWSAAHGDLAHSGSGLGAGSIGTATSGGVSKNPTIWAHPPDGGITVLSWVLRLPDATALRLGLSFGLGDGATSADGVEFSVRVNGLPYWRATTQIDQWLSASLDLTGWKSQNVLVELVTDSLGNYGYDWAYWADLVLSTSTTTCSYGVPAPASIGASGGSFTANVTATTTCSWSASSNVPWLTISAGSGSGNGTVSYVAAANAGPARSGTLTIAGKNLVVTQSAQSGTCTVAISPTSTTFLSTASPGSVTVTTPSFCAWTVSNLPSWISTTSGGSGAGSGTWKFSVVPNDSGQVRSQVVSVAGVNFTATQSATASLSIVSTFSPNALTISTSEGAPYGDCDFWLMGGCSGSTNLGYGPTRVMRLYICLSGEVTYSDCAQAPTPTGPLSPTMLNDISTRLASAAGSGVRLLIRFIYNMGHPGTTAPDPTAPDAPLAAILTHIDQLAPILIQNKDVIFALEAGFIGTWGEWHDSTNGNDTAAAHKAVLDKELSHFNGVFPILVRYPGDLIVYAGGPVPPAGLGIHNDYYDSNSDDGATFNTCIPNIGYCLPGYSKEQLMSYTEQVSAGAMFAGEFGETNTTMQSCAALDAYSYRFHLQSIALLGGFAPPVTFPFLQSSGCATSFLNKVGTRIELQRASISGNVAPGSTLSVAITLVNAGYGRVLRARPATFVLMSGGAVVAQYPISLQTMDLRLLAASSTPAPRTFQFNVVLPSTLPLGLLSAALWIPDPGPSLTSEPAYALPLNSVDQNQNAIFDSATGYNAIGAFATGCTAGIASSAQTFGASSATGSVAVATGGGCSWSVDNIPAWATTSSGASGAGPGVWRFTVAANGGGTRSQSMTVAGQPFTLTQLGVAVKTRVAGTRSLFDLADAAAENWSAIEAVGGRSYCAQVAPAPTALSAATPTLTAFRADGATILAGGTLGTRRACFVAPVTESVLVKLTQADTSTRSHLLVVTETTLWANWFYIAGNYSSYTILRNTTESPVNAAVTWRGTDGASVGTKSVLIPPRGVVYYDARPPTTSGAAVAGSVEIAHDGEPQALVGSQTTISATNGLSFDTIGMQRRQR